jgi:hypothetical protein
MAYELSDLAIVGAAAVLEQADGESNRHYVGQKISYAL